LFFLIIANFSAEEIQTTSAPACACPPGILAGWPFQIRDIVLDYAEAVTAAFEFDDSFSR